MKYLERREPKSAPTDLNEKHKSQVDTIGKTVDNVFYEQKEHVYRVFVGRPERKRPLGRPRRRWEDNINMDLREIGIDGANWIQLVQERFQWRVFVNTVMNLRVP
jgi:hypothetical protein